jgi:hypothetical protein
MRFEILEDKIDDSSSSQALVDCVLLAHRFFELELPDLDELKNQDKEGKGSVFDNWTVEGYVDNEAALLYLLDYCLYPRDPLWALVKNK